MPEKNVRKQIAKITNKYNISTKGYGYAANEIVISELYVLFLTMAKEILDNVLKVEVK